MPASSNGNEAPNISKELEKLQLRWEAKTQFKELHGGMWLPAVLFGIEVGRRRIAEEDPADITALDELTSGWYEIMGLEPTGPAKEALKGIDFGIRLVRACVQRYLRQLQEKSVRPKPPASANNGKTRLGHKRGPRPQA